VTSEPEKKTRNNRGNEKPQHGKPGNLSEFGPKMGNWLQVTRKTGKYPGNGF
jgi:hypothetical protein